MSKELPNDGEVVEIQIDGVWIKATFRAAGCYWTPLNMIWWMNYFYSEDCEYYPQPQSGDDLPIWRRIKT